MVGRLFLACYAVWRDPARDAENVALLRETVKDVELLGIGHYVAESDLLAAPTRAVGSFAQPQWQRLEQLRAQRDPDGASTPTLASPLVHRGSAGAFGAHPEVLLRWGSRRDRPMQGKRFGCPRMWTGLRRRPLARRRRRPATGYGRTNTS